MERVVASVSDTASEVDFIDGLLMGVSAWSSAAFGGESAAVWGGVGMQIISDCLIVALTSG
jgi:hypothetical protein